MIRFNGECQCLRNAPIRCICKCLCNSRAKFELFRGLPRLIGSSKFIAQMVGSPADSENLLPNELVFSCLS